MKICEATDADHDEIWRIFHEVVAAGDTYAFDPDTPREGALWRIGLRAERTRMSPSRNLQGRRRRPRESTPSPTVIQGRDIVGTYILRPNQSGGGSHVANAAFMVAPEARGQGIGRAMGEHCLSEARRLGFRAMQFNFVVSTNESAVRLWQQLGFEIVGTLPGAFRHPEKGYIDVYVMHRSLLGDQA